MNDFKSIKKHILTKQHFLDRLRIEKRRTDRSKLPLSVALLPLPDEAIHNKKVTQEFLKLIYQNTRETDIRGWFDHDIVGVILTDTGKQGAQRCIENLLNGESPAVSALQGGVPASPIARQGGPALPAGRKGHNINATPCRTASAFGAESFNPQTYRSDRVTLRTYPDDLFDSLLAAGEDPADFLPMGIDESIKPRRTQAMLKRLMDMTGAVIGLLLTSPLMLLAALMVKTSSPGPAVFRQIRLGKKGIRFPFYKFRSMYCSTDDKIHREYVTQLIQGNLEKINEGDEDKPLYKIKSDPRVTRVGKIIRKTSIDELPQFFNVLKGEMSLVGPRPPLLYEVEKYEPWHLRRILEVKPGITGLWQVEGRSTTSFDDMVRLDLQYAQNESLWLDIKILLKTVKTVVHAKGAH